VAVVATATIAAVVVVAAATTTRTRRRDSKWIALNECEEKSSCCGMNAQRVVARAGKQQVIRTQEEKQTASLAMELQQQQQQQQMERVVDKASST
jgi:uncharacterized membrane protein YhiD involved in acid resistance